MKNLLLALVVVAGSCIFAETADARGPVVVRRGLFGGPRVVVGRNFVLQNRGLFGRRQVITPLGFNRNVFFRQRFNPNVVFFNSGFNNGFAGYGGSERERWRIWWPELRGLLLIPYEGSESVGALIRMVGAPAF